MCRLAWLFVLTFAAFHAPARAATPEAISAQRAAEIVAVLQGQREAAESFAERFLSEVPPAKLAALVRQLQAEHGKLLGAEAIEAENTLTATFRLRFERAHAVAKLTLEAAGPHKIGGFWITSVIPADDDPAKIAADFAALPGRAGFAVVKLGDKSEVVSGAKADEQFAVGSTFKLWVLDALAEEIAAGRRRWDEVVTLGPRSLPSGILQDWPEGAALTIETLATLMISRSDNTATDALIRLVGRERIGDRVRAIGHANPARMLPMLTTAESFALKLGPPAVRQAYANADEAGQARMLAALDPYKVIAGADPASLAAPTAIDSVEWFAAPADIARLLDSLRRRSDPHVLRILAVAPSLPAGFGGSFAYAGYKGGSEPGVLNLTWLLRDKTGEWTVVTASWNDPDKPVDNARLGKLAERLLALAAH